MSFPPPPESDEEDQKRQQNPLLPVAETLIASLRLAIRSAEEAIAWIAEEDEDEEDRESGSRPASTFAPSNAVAGIDEAVQRLGEFREILQFDCCEVGGEADSGDAKEGSDGKAEAEAASMGDVRPDPAVAETLPMASEAEASKLRPGDGAGGPRGGQPPAPPAGLTIPVESLAVSQLFQLVEEFQRRDGAAFRASLGSVIRRGSVLRRTDSGAVGVTFPPTFGGYDGGRTEASVGAAEEGAPPQSQDPEGKVVSGGVASERHRDRLWNAKFSDLCDHHRRLGTFSVDQLGPSKALHNWVNKQRKMYKQRERGEPNTLSDDRFRALESVGFDWAPKPKKRREDGKACSFEEHIRRAVGGEDYGQRKPAMGGRQDNGQRKPAMGRQDAVWFERLGELREYHGVHKSFQILTADSQALRYWVNKQRREHKKRERGEKTTLTEERFRALGGIGFFDEVVTRGRKRKQPDAGVGV